MKLFCTLFLSIIYTVLVFKCNAKLTESSDENLSTKVTDCTGLTAKQKQLVQDSWALLDKDPLVTGAAIMIAFLKNYPEYQGHFKIFGDAPLKDLPKVSIKFQTHCRNLMKGLNRIIETINDPVQFKNSLVEIGAGHVQHGATSTMFNQLKVVVPYVLKETIKEKYTLELEEAWVKTLDAAFAGMVKALTSA